MSTLLVTGATALAIGVAPAAADAASVGYSGGTITYTAAPGEANQLGIAPWGAALMLTDSGTKGKKASAIHVTAGPGCYQVSSSAAACPASAMRVDASLGDGNDQLEADLATAPLAASGGAGDDVLRGGLAVDSLDGGIGNDTFEARDESADTLVCGDGTDAGNADAIDAVAGDCETVLKAAPADSGQPDPAGTVTNPVPDPQTDPRNPEQPAVDPTVEPAVDPAADPSTPDRTTAPVTIPAQTVAVSASGVASVRVVCPADSGGCSGVVAIELPRGSAVKRGGKLVSAARRRTSAPLKIGRAKFTAAAGTEQVVPVRLTKRGRQRIVKGRRGRARIVVKTRKADGTVAVETQDVTIRCKRAPSRRGAGRR